MNKKVQPDLAVIIYFGRSGGDIEPLLARIEDSIRALPGTEKIVVTDQAPEKSMRPLGQLDASWTVRKNGEFAGAPWRFNEAAKAATARNLVFLKCDASPAPDCLPIMLRLLENPPGSFRPGAVGPLYLTRQKSRIVIHEAGGGLDPEPGFCRRALAGENPSGLPPAWDWSFLSDSCLMVPRELFLRLGGFEETLMDGGSDVDFCLRLKKAGYACLASTEARVDRIGAGGDPEPPDSRPFLPAEGFPEFIRKNWNESWKAAALMDYRRVPFRREQRRWEHIQIGVKTPPDVSILTSIYNALDHTREFVNTLPFTLPPSLKTELILVNDGSDEETTEFLRSLGPPWIVKDNDDNRGFAWRNNEAAKMASGRKLLFLNNDVYLRPGWLEPMLDVYARPPANRRVGCVGNLQTYGQTEILNHAGVYFHPGDFTLRHAWDGMKTPPRADVYDWYAVTAACMLCPRDVFLEAGSFDEKFRNGYEDADLCLRLLREGYTHFVANRSRIGHDISSSPGRFEAEDRNFRYFQEKWGSWFHLLARRDFARIFLRVQNWAEAAADWRNFAYALACRLQPERPFATEPTLAWQKLAHGGSTPDDTTRHKAKP